MMDAVLKYMLDRKIPLTQRNYLSLAYWDGRKFEDLNGEELAELPPDFEHWPVAEVKHVN